MRFSMRTDYGVRALIDLAQHQGQGPVQCSEIAQRQMVPEPFLDQVLAVLRKAGLVRSTRGPRGGHVLARDPSEITVLDIVRALEGSLSPVPYLDEPGDQCEQTHAIAQRHVWERVRDLVTEYLRSVSVQTLADEEAEREARTMYYI